MIGLLAQAGLTSNPDPRYGWLPVGLLLIIGIGFAVVNILASVLIGPSAQVRGRKSPTKAG